MHGASLVKELKSLCNADFVGIGGELLADAGVSLLFSMDELSVMGFGEALYTLPRLYGIMKSIVSKAENIDAAIFIDYPGFNIQLARYFNKLGIKNFYYIIPQVWAWWNWRVRWLKKYFTHLFAIYPFEVPFFNGFGIPVTYVGNPLIDIIENEKPGNISVGDGKKVVGLLPGSRMGEVKRLLPVMMDIKRRLERKSRDIVFLLSLVPDMEFSEPNVMVMKGRARDIMRKADVVIVASGTASVEAALLGVPQIVVYNLSYFSYFIASHLASVNHASLVNIMLGREIVPEFIQHIPSDRISDICWNILTQKEQGEYMREMYKQLRETLKGGAAKNAALHIQKEVCDGND